MLFNYISSSLSEIRFQYNAQQKRDVRKILKSCCYLNKYYQCPWGIRMCFVQMRAWLTQWRIWSYRCSLPARKRSWDKTHFVTALFQLWLDHNGVYLWATTSFKTPEEGIRRPKKKQLAWQIRSPSTDIAGMEWADPDRQTNWGCNSCVGFLGLCMVFHEGGLCFGRNCGLTPVSREKKELIEIKRDLSTKWYFRWFFSCCIWWFPCSDPIWPFPPHTPKDWLPSGSQRVPSVQMTRMIKSRHLGWVWEVGCQHHGFQCRASFTQNHTHTWWSLLLCWRFLLRIWLYKMYLQVQISPPVKMHSIEAKNGQLEER